MKPVLVGFYKLYLHDIGDNDYEMVFMFLIYLDLMIF